MNTAIIVLIIFFILIILGVIGYFVYKYYNTNKIPCPENDISNYNISDTPLKASDLLQRIFTRVSVVMNRIREKFDLSPGTVTSISSMIPGAQYTRGTLKSGVSNTQFGAKNGGINNCSPFPQTIYTPASSPPPPSTALNTVQYIRIIRNAIAPDGTSAIHFAEIKFYDYLGNIIPISPTVIYLNTSGGQSSGLTGYPASNLIDNNISTFCHTNNFSNDFVQINLPYPIVVSRIELTNRQDCCQNRAINTRVETFPGPGSTPSTTVNITDTRSVYNIIYNSSSQPVIR